MGEELKFWILPGGLTLGDTDIHMQYFCIELCFKRKSNHMVSTLDLKSSWYLTCWKVRPSVNFGLRLTVIKVIGFPIHCLFEEPEGRISCHQNGLMVLPKKPILSN